MASIDRKKEKKLKEAEKTYNKWKRAYLSGRISKEELKDKLRPYKYELHELNLVKLKEGENPPEEKDEEKTEIKKPVSYSPWKKRSSLTIDEIEERIDMLSLESRPSETLQKLYERRYGEELEPPGDLLTFHIDDEVSQDTESLEEAGDILDEGEAGVLSDPSSKDDDIKDIKEKKPFWKGILKRKNREKPEAET